MSQETKFLEVRFKNFQSFGNQWTVIDLQNRGTTLLVGENLDEGGSSGAGKTTAMSVVAYCLYDKIPTKVSKDRMINMTNGKKNTSMEAILTFSKDGHEYKIHRSRGSVTAVQLFEDGKDITPASVDEVNGKLEELVGFSYNLFSQIVLFNGNSKQFLELSVGEQRELIEELFKITLLSRKASALKKEASETTKQIGLLKVLVKSQEEQNEGYRKRLDEAEQRVVRWEVNHAEEIKKQENLLHALESVDFASEEALHKRIEEIAQITTEVDTNIKLLNGQKTAKQRETSPLQGKLEVATSNQTKKTRELQKLEEELVHLRDARCPYCRQAYGDAQLKIEELEGTRNQLLDELEEFTTEARKLQQEIQAFNDEKNLALAQFDNEVAQLRVSVSDLLKESGELQSVLSYKTLKEQLSAQAAIETVRDKVAKLQSETNPHLDAYDSLKAEGEITIDYDGLNGLVNLEAHQKFLIKLLTDKNSFVRKNLIATTTPFLNKRIGYYLERLNLPHVVLFQPDLTCQISQLGREMDHGNLSNGEKKKLNISICLAFRDVLTYLHSKVNVLFTDEVDGGSISGNDVDCLIGLLKKKAWDDEISIFIISHRPEFEGRCDRNYVIRKEQGFSSLIIQPDG